MTFWSQDHRIINYLLLVSSLLLIVKRLPLAHAKSFSTVSSRIQSSLMSSCNAAIVWSFVWQQEVKLGHRSKVDKVLSAFVVGEGVFVLNSLKSPSAVKLLKVASKSLASSDAFSCIVHKRGWNPRTLCRLALDFAVICLYAKQSASLLSIAFLLFWVWGLFSCCMMLIWGLTLTTIPLFLFSLLYSSPSPSFFNSEKSPLFGRQLPSRLFLAIGDNGSIPLA